MKSGSHLEKVLTAGHFAFTAELEPPRGTSAGEVREKASHLKGNVDAVNITDNQTAVVCMSSWAACLILLQEGLEPNFQMVCRDRNRLAGDHPTAKGVFDIDSMQLIGMVKGMRDEGKFMSGGDIEEPPRMFIGAAANPFAEPFDWRVYRLAKKVKAGVDFIQTQCIYNMEKFRKWIERANDMGLTEKVHILAGVTPMKSVEMAGYMKTEVPGMDVPEEIITRLQGAGKGKVADEGIKIACEQIEELKEMEGVAGVHLMAIEWEHKVPQIAEMAKVLPRPQVG
jgi:methylenetetrahydrofolate reductase (NADPH)